MRAFSNVKVAIAGVLFDETSFFSPLLSTNLMKRYRSHETAVRAATVNSPLVTQCTTRLCLCELNHNAFLATGIQSSFSIFSYMLLAGAGKRPYRSSTNPGTFLLQSKRRNPIHDCDCKKQYLDPKLAYMDPPLYCNIS